MPPRRKKKGHITKDQRQKPTITPATATTNTATIANANVNGRQRINAIPRWKLATKFCSKAQKTPISFIYFENGTPRLRYMQQRFVFKEETWPTKDGTTLFKWYCWRKEQFEISCLRSE